MTTDADPRARDDFSPEDMAIVRRALVYFSNKPAIKPSDRERAYAMFQVLRMETTKVPSAPVEAVPDCSACGDTGIGEALGADGRPVLATCPNCSATTPPQAEPLPPPGDFDITQAMLYVTTYGVQMQHQKFAEADATRARLRALLTAELQEVRKDAVIHRGGERPSDGWYWMRWHVDGPTPTPWALLNTFAGPMLETTEWAGPLKPPAAAMTKEKP